MANPAPTINQINAFNATQGTTIDFNIIGGTELVRSNRIYIYDLSDNSLICTHLYVSTESIHELPANTDGSIVYESGKSSADFVNGAQYYAQIQTFTDIAGTEGGSGLSVAKMFWCLVDPTLTITTIPSTISTTSYNVSATYDANTSVVSNIIQQYQFSLYSATGSLLQSSGVIVGSGEQQGTSTAYDISYNFTGLSVGSSYYTTVEVTTTQGMSVSAQSSTFTVSIDTPTLGEATVVNNACDGYISVTSNLSGEYGGSGSGDIVTFETDSENVFTKLQVDIEPTQDLNGYDKPWVGGAGKNKLPVSCESTVKNGVTYTVYKNSSGAVIRIHAQGTATAAHGFGVVDGVSAQNPFTLKAGSYWFKGLSDGYGGVYDMNLRKLGEVTDITQRTSKVALTLSEDTQFQSCYLYVYNGKTINTDIYPMIWLQSESDDFEPYSNICPISGHDEVEVDVVGKNLFDIADLMPLAVTGSVAEVPNGYDFWANAPMYSTGVELKKPLQNPLTLSMDVVNTGGKNLRFRVWYTDGTAESLNAAGSGQGDGGHVSITVHKDVEKIGFDWSTSGRFTVTNLQVESGTVETTYEPYTETTVSQDFDVSLTPTSKDTDPYLFKAVGDIYGDRLEEDIVGATVNWNQLVQTAKKSNSHAPSGLTTYDTINTAVLLQSGRVYFVIAEFVFNGSRTDVRPYLQVGDGYVKGGSQRFFGGSGAKMMFGGFCKPATNVELTAGITTAGSALSSSDEWGYSKLCIFDVTQMLGSVIADYWHSFPVVTAQEAYDSMARFKLFAPKDDYEYDTGTLKSVNPTAHVTRGVNAWDEEWEVGSINSSGQNTTGSSTIRSKNYTRILPNTAYYLKGTFEAVFWYDKNKTLISTNYSGGIKTSPTNARYLRFYCPASYGTTYKNDICINISDPTINGKYFPYEEHTYELGNVPLYGVFQLENGKLKAYGDVRHAVGGTDRKFAKLVLDGTSGQFSEVSQAETADGNLYVAYIPSYVSRHKFDGYAICDGYVWADMALVNLHKGEFDTRGSYIRFVIADQTITTLSAWNAYLASHPITIIYELATTTTDDTPSFTQIQEVSKYGTIEYITNNGIPVGHNTTYMTRDVFGGYIDLVSGRLVVTHKTILLDGTEDLWTEYPSYETQICYLRDVFEGAIPKKILQPNWGISNYMQCVTNILSGTITAGQMSNSTANSRKNLYMTYVSGITTLSAWKTYLATHPLQLCYELNEPLTYQLTPQQINTLVGTNNVWSEQGDIELSYHIPITNLLVKRQDVDDVSGNWLTLYSQPVEQASDMDFTFIDFLNQYGKTYKYALVPLLTQTQSGVEVEVEGGYTVSDEVQSIFDGVFISDSTGSQKCKANVGYGNVNMNQSVGSITPIGSQYPIIVTNSNNRYHNGSISGMIVPDDYYYNGNLSRIDMVNKRNELEQFLTNKRAKIIKDWNSNIWLVMIMDNIDCSFDNNYGMGIVTFNANWLEIGDPTNQEDLQATGLVNVGGV